MMKHYCRYIRAVDHLATMVTCVMLLVFATYVYAQLYVNEIKIFG